MDGSICVRRICAGDRDCRVAWRDDARLHYDSVVGLFLRSVPLRTGCPSQLRQRRRGGGARHLQRGVDGRRAADGVGRQARLAGTRRPDGRRAGGGAGAPPGAIDGGAGTGAHVGRGDYGRAPRIAALAQGGRWCLLPPDRRSQARRHFAGRQLSAAGGRFVGSRRLRRRFAVRRIDAPADAGRDGIPAKPRR